MLSRASASQQWRGSLLLKGWETPAKRVVSMPSGTSSEGLDDSQKEEIRDRLSDMMLQSLCGSSASEGTASEFKSPEAATPRGGSEWV